MPRGQEFGKTPQTLPIKAKNKKAKHKLEDYTMQHFGSDGVVQVVRLKAECKSEALEKFRLFVHTLELSLAGAGDEELLFFMQENPLP